jgi:hypothetical protein
VQINAVVLPGNGAIPNLTVHEGDSVHGFQKQQTLMSFLYTSTSLSGSLV